MGESSAARLARAEAQVWAIVADRYSRTASRPGPSAATEAILAEVADHHLDPYAAADRLSVLLTGESRTMTIERVFVAGAGLMGHGIAQVHAAIGVPVVLYEPDLARAEAGRDRIAATSIGRWPRAG